MGNYPVVRLVPESPVDGGTFSSYLEDLQLQVFDAYNDQIPLSDPVFSSPYGLTQWGPLGIWLVTVTAMTTAETAYSTTNTNYGTTLALDKVDGIPEGAYVFSDDQTSSNPVIPASDSYQVVAVDGGANTVTLQNPLSNFVPAGTVLTFISQPPSGATTATSASTPAFSFSLTAATVANENGLAVLTFGSAPAGVLVGMSVTGSFLTGSATVAEVDSDTSTVTLSTSASSASSSSVAVNFALEPPYVSFPMTPSLGSGNTLTFPLGGANGIAVKMTVNPVSGLVAPGTTVISITQQPAPPATPTTNIVTLSKALLGTLTGSQSLTFTFQLSTGIVQHTEVVGITFGFFGMREVIGPLRWPRR